MANFYTILGITKDSTTEEIKAAFRLKAKEYHPDIKGDAYADLFSEIKLAYDTLIDEYSRRKYNETGYVGYTSLELKNLANTRLRDMFIQVLNEFSANIFEMNIVDIIQNRCIENIKTCKNNIDINVKEIRKLQLIRDKFSMKKNIPEDVINNIFAEGFADLNNCINTNLNQIQTLEKVSDIISSYVFNFDQKV